MVQELTGRDKPWVGTDRHSRHHTVNHHRFTRGASAKRWRLAGPQARQARNHGDSLPVSHPIATRCQAQSQPPATAVQPRRCQR